jgi:hypothetical protein
MEKQAMTETSSAANSLMDQLYYTLQIPTEVGPRACKMAAVS